eukprot:ctg_1093.g451
MALGANHIGSTFTRRAYTGLNAPAAAAPPRSGSAFAGVPRFAWRAPPVAAVSGPGAVRRRRRSLCGAHGAVVPASRAHCRLPRGPSRQHRHLFETHPPHSRTEKRQDASPCNRWIHFTPHTRRPNRCIHTRPDVPRRVPGRSARRVGAARRPDGSAAAGHRWGAVLQRCSVFAGSSGVGGGGSGPGMKRSGSSDGDTSSSAAPIPVSPPAVGSERDGAPSKPMPLPDAVSPRARHTPTRADAAATSEAQLRGAQMEAGEYATFQSLVRDWSPFETRQAITETAQEPHRRLSVRRDAGALAAYLSQEAVGMYQLHYAKSGGGDGSVLPEAPEGADGGRVPPEVQAYRKALEGAYDAFVHVLRQQNGKHVQQRALVGIEQVPAVFRVPASAFRLEDTEAYQQAAAADSSEAMSEHEAAAQQELRRYWAFCEASMRAQLLDSTRAARGADIDTLLYALGAVRQRSLQPAVDALHRMREHGDSARARLQHSRAHFQQLLGRRRQLAGLLRTLECLQRAHNQLRAVHELLQAHDWLRAARLHCELHCLLHDGSIDAFADGRRQGAASDTAGISTQHGPALSVVGELERQHVAHGTALHDGIVQLAMSRFSEVVTLAPEATSAAATDTATASSPLDIDAYRSEMRAYVQALNELGSLEHALDRFVYDALNDLATVAVSAASMHEDDSAQAFVAVLDRCEVLAEGVAVLLELCWDAREQPSLLPTARPDGAVERPGGRTRALTAASNTFLGELLGRIGRILPRLLPSTDQPVEADAERWAAAWRRLRRFHRRLGDRFARMCTVLPTAAPLTSLLEEHTMQWLRRRHEEYVAEVERALERDTWSRSTSLPSMQATVGRLTTLVGGPAAVSGSTNEGAVTASDGVWIQGTAFVVADALGPLLTALCWYAQCAVQLDAYASGARRWRYADCRAKVHHCPAPGGVRTHVGCADSVAGRGRCGNVGRPGRLLFAVCGAQRRARPGNDTSGCAASGRSGVRRGFGTAAGAVVAGECAAGSGSTPAAAAGQGGEHHGRALEETGGGDAQSALGGIGCGRGSPKHTRAAERLCERAGQRGQHAAQNPPADPGRRSPGVPDGADQRHLRADPAGGVCPHRGRVFASAADEARQHAYRPRRAIAAATHPHLAAAGARCPLGCRRPAAAAARRIP